MTVTRAPAPGRIGRLAAVAILMFLPCLSGAESQSAWADAGRQPLRPDTIEARVAACTHCHGVGGKAGPDGYYPRLAGKPQAYLLEQLINFRDGRRSYQPMRHLLAGLPDAYLGELATYFADMHLPYPAPEKTRVSQATLEQGRVLVQSGDPARGLPACIACHGSGLAGVAPATPGLLGLPGDYLISQLGGWRTGLRHAREPDCMATVANKLTPEEIGAVTAWLASQAVAEPYVPAPAGTAQSPLKCGSQSPAPGSQP